MNDLPFSGGAVGRGIQAVQHLHHVAGRHKKPEVRQTLSGAVVLIVELIEDRARRHALDDRWDRPPDEG